MESKNVLNDFFKTVLGENRSILERYLGVSNRQLLKKLSGQVALNPAEINFFKEVLTGEYGIIHNNTMLHNRVSLNDFLVLESPKVVEVESFLKTKGYSRIEIVNALERTMPSWKGLIQRDSSISIIEYNWLLLVLHCHPNNKNI